MLAPGTNPDLLPPFPLLLASGLENMKSHPSAGVRNHKFGFVIEHTRFSAGSFCDSSSVLAAPQLVFQDGNQSLNGARRQVHLVHLFFRFPGFLPFPFWPRFLRFNFKPIFEQEIIETHILSCCNIGSPLSCQLHPFNEICLFSRGFALLQIVTSLTPVPVCLIKS
jgi:hypothetical protein